VQENNCMNPYGFGYQFCGTILKGFRKVKKMITEAIRVHAVFSCTPTRVKMHANGTRAPGRELRFAARAFALVASAFLLVIAGQAETNYIVLKTVRTSMGELVSHRTSDPGK